MASARSTTALRLALCTLLGTPLVGCGGGEASDPSGVYVPKHPDLPFIFIEKFDFQSGGKVAVTAFGAVSVGEYVITEDGHVRVVTSTGAKANLKLAGDGCLLAESDPGMVAEAEKDGMDLNELGLYCPE